MGRGLRYSSGRVIAVGRLLLATLYLLAILFDASQPAREPVATYAMLAAYLAFAAITLAMTWRDWWLDARIARVAHAIDILFFTLLVMMTAGYTSPYFTFFMFVLLSAAIRWGWRATALTAILLVFVYMFVGSLVARATLQPGLQHFAVRTGHLVIMSLILLWFGASRWRQHLDAPAGGLVGSASLDQSPLAASLRAAMAGLGAASGAFLWREHGLGGFAGILIHGEDASEAALPAKAVDRAIAGSAFLYDVATGRALRKDEERNAIGFAASDAITQQAAERLGLNEGLAVPVRAGDGEGILFLDGVPGLSTDHIDFAEQLGASIAAHVQGHALLKAAEESAEARSRLTLARDLHDGVVQFLASAAFRLEAIKRAEGSGRDLAGDIEELKQLVLQEQRELRSFITALRSGPQVSFDDLTADLRSLADRLSRQWDVRCAFVAKAADLQLPTRTHLDAHQLMREAVANAVRHAQSKSIEVEVVAKPGELRLKLINDGAPFPLHKGRPELPASLKERVDRAGGTIDMTRGMGVTRFLITLPIAVPGA